MISTTIQCLTPNPKSHQHAEWVCNVCKHQWMATLANVVHRKTGCPECKRQKHIVKQERARIHASDTFVTKARRVHGLTYDYSHVQYERASAKVTIICPVHGAFSQTPNTHLNGAGCPECKLCKLRDLNSHKAAAYRHTFIDRCVAIHGMKYDYTKVVYTRSCDKITIVCPTHGEFYATPSKHLEGTGCPGCANDSLCGHYTDRYFVKYPHKRNNPAYVYIIVCYDVDNSLFVKVGITSGAHIRNRLQTYKKFLHAHLLTISPILLYDAFCVEQQLLAAFADKKYVPQRKFSGHTECLQYSDNLVAQYIVYTEELCRGRAIHTPQKLELSSDAITNAKTC